MGKFKILFYGFRHGHIYALYDLVSGDPNWEIVGCVEPHAEARAAAEAKLGISFSDTPYEDWLQTDVDVVAIGNAYGLRGQNVIDALQAGKHVLADKPLCTSLAQFQEIRRLSEEKDLKVGCMLDLRDLPQAKLAKEILHSGRLGQVRNVAFNGQHCIDYDHRPGWYFEPGMHGGTLNDLSIHGIDLIRILTGLEFAKIDAARVWNAYATRHPHFKDCGTFAARLENGAGVLADTSYAAPYVTPALPFYWEFRFWCDKGVLTFSCTEPEVVLYEQGNPGPAHLQAAPTGGTYLSDFAGELLQNTRWVTENAFASTKTALEIQQLADREE